MAGLPSSFSPAPHANGRRPLLVVGCGNWMAGDDGVGLELARRLRDLRGCDCAPRDMPRLSLELLDLFDKAERVLFVDAVVTGAPAGTIHIVPLPWPGMEPRALGSVTTHGWGINEILRLGRVLHREIPRLLLLGIEIEGISPGAPLSPSARHALDVAVEGFTRFRSWLLCGGDRLQSPRSFSPEEAFFPAAPN